jgi:hypothetical protein
MGELGFELLQIESAEVLDGKKMLACRFTAV